MAARWAAQFLASIGSHRLFALFHLIAMHGLRQGEACGLVGGPDLDEGLAYLSRQVLRISRSLPSPFKHTPEPPISQVRFGVSPT
jgi:hypothetical protein